MIESAGKPRASKSKTEKVKVERSKAEKSDTLRAASVRGGSSGRNAEIKAESGSEANNTAQGNIAAGQEAATIDFAADPTNHVNRELSWLGFNCRVLSESRGKSIPLSERLKFLSIAASNLGEFYMVRAVSLKNMVYAKYTRPDIAGLTSREQLDRINERIRELVGMQYSAYNRSLVPALRQNGLRIITEHEDVTEEEATYTDEYFKKNAYPVLTPMVFDSSRSFPLIRNKTLNIAALLRKKSDKDEELEFAMMQVPSVISRAVGPPREIDEDGKERRVATLLEEIVERNMPSLSLSYDIMASYPFRTMKNADLTVDGGETMDLLEGIQEQPKKRQRDEAIRLEIKGSVDKRLLKITRRELFIDSQDIFEISSPLDLAFFMKMYGLEGLELFKVPGYVSQPVPAFMNEDNILTNIKRGDILSHHPYQNSDPVVNFMYSIARDPEVLAIKQTLYRASGNFPIIAALAEAVDNGRQVPALVELKTHFDEEDNINWAKMLEEAGCYAIHGPVGLKTHSRITLVVRMEEDGIRRYVHLGIGNYNDSTAKLHTDCGILTCNPQIGEDTTAVFNMLSDYSEPLAWNKLSMALLWFEGRFLRMIRRETEHAKAGRPVHTIAKMNSLCGKETITALYEVSCAGVKVEMIIRGIRCLKAGVPGLSEDISVRFTVGSFLEHSRTSYFLNDASPGVYMDSADWMPRNLDRRVEILFPAGDETLREKMIHILEVGLEGNVKAHILQPDDSCRKEDKKGRVLVNPQGQFCREAVLMAKESADEGDPIRGGMLKPIMSNS